MNNYQSAQKSESNPKEKAIASLILGIISVILAMLIFVGGVVEIILLRYPSYAWWTWISGIATIIIQGGFFFLMELIIIIAGLISGVLGLKSTRKNFAMKGIILCVISLICLGASIYIWLPIAAMWAR
jgi:cation transport ATPase